MEFNFDEIFGTERNNDFMKRVRRELEEIVKAIESKDLKGKWGIQQIDEPGVKGYIIKGGFWLDQPLDPIRPFEPHKPFNKRPTPQKPFVISRNALKEIREPLTDIFEEEQHIQIYVKLLGEKKDDIQLNVMNDKVEVKAKNFYKLIELPARNIEIEKTSSKFKNGVLKVTIPKRQESPQRKKQKIKID